MRLFFQTLCNKHLVIKSFDDLHVPYSDFIWLFLIAHSLGWNWMEFKKSTTLLAWAITGILALSSFAMEHDYLSLIKTVWEIPEMYGIEKLGYYSTFEFNLYLRYGIMPSVPSLFFSFLGSLKLP